MYIKLLAVITSLLLILSLCACSVKKDSEKDSKTTGKSSETTQDSSPDEFIPGVVIENTKGTTAVDVPANDNGNDGSADTPSSDSNEESGKTTASTDSKGTETGKTVETTKKPTDTQGNKDTSVTQKPSKVEDTKDNSSTSKPTDTQKAPSPEDVSYEEYHAMTFDDQQAFFNSFDSVEAFFDWYKVAKAEYEAENPDKEIGDGAIDLGDLIG